MREVILHVHFDDSPLRRKKFYRKALKLFDGINWINRMSFLFYRFYPVYPVKKLGSALLRPGRTIFTGDGEKGVKEKSRP
jgi:hypothetical protein